MSMQESEETFDVSVLFFFKDDPLHRWVHTIGVKGIPTKGHIKHMKEEVAEILIADGFGKSDSGELDFCLVPKESMDVFYDMMSKNMRELEQLTKAKDGIEGHEHKA
jgi:hypothetical protein